MFSLHPTIHELMERPCGVGESMQLLIDAHHRECPQDDWEPFRRLPYDSEAIRLSRNWFPAVIEDDPPVSLPVKGLFFGLYQPSMKRVDFYLGGASRFELDSGFDWAVGPEYFPRLRYADSSVLARIYQISYATKDGLGTEAEESLCLGFVAFAAKAMFADADFSLLVEPGARVGVAVGWDSGVPLYLGWLTSQGFAVRSASEAIAGIKKQAAAAAERVAAIEARFRRPGSSAPPPMSDA